MPCIAQITVLKIIEYCKNSYGWHQEIKAYAHHKTKQIGMEQDL